MKTPTHKIELNYPELMFLSTLYLNYVKDVDNGELRKETKLFYPYELNRMKNLKRFLTKITKHVIEFNNEINIIRQKELKKIFNNIK